MSPPAAAASRIHSRGLTPPARHVNSSVRRGSVLLIVLVIVAMLTLAAYQFTELMVAEAEATAMYARRAESRAFADSGVEWTAALLGRRDEVAFLNLFHNPELFAGRLLRDSDMPRGRGRFSIVAPVQGDPEAQSIRFGVIDESGKLNLNTLVKIDEQDSDDEGLARDVLLLLPGMTHEIADAILDWLDEDETPRQFGAETEFYSTLSPPYEAKNGPLETLDDLLLIRGITPELLYGGDINRNGLIDPNEDAAIGDLLASATGEPHPLGWSGLFTVHSRELNRQVDGTARINLNERDLAALYDGLVEEFQEDGNAEEIATFITAYRLNGPASADDDDEGDSRSGRSGGGRSGGGGGGRGGGSSRSGEGGSGGSGSSGGGRGSGETRGGLDVSGRARQTINSIYDLIDVEVRAEINGTQTTLTSPWTSDAAELQALLPDLLDRVSTSGEQFLEGRININEAPLEVVLGVPGMTDDLAERIVKSRPLDAGGAPSVGDLSTRATTAWLLAEGLVDLEQMRELDRYLTARGDVFRIQVVGHFDEGGPVSRVEAVIDATQMPAQVVFHRDLSDLGSGYTSRQLGGERLP